MRTTTWIAVAALALGASQAVAQPSTDLDDYVLFANSGLKTKGLTIPSGGDVGVNRMNARLVAPRFLVAPSSNVASDRVRLSLEPANTPIGQLYANVVERAAVPATAFTVPIIANLPAACGFPAPFPACDGGNDVKVTLGGTTALPPGVYGSVRVTGAQGIAATLELAGAYTFCDLKVGRGSEVVFTGPTTLNVAGNVILGPDGYLGPELLSGLGASDVQLYVVGPKVRFSRGTDVTAHLCAPTAKLQMTQGGNHEGSFVADLIRTEEVSLMPGSPSGAFLE